MTDATSSYLNIPVRTEIEAKCEILPKRYPGWTDFQVRAVYFDKTGGDRCSSYPCGPDFRDIEEWTFEAYGRPDAFGLYGNPPKDELQYHLSDCALNADAITLKEAFQKAGYYV